MPRGRTTKGSLRKGRGCGKRVKSRPKAAAAAAPSKSAPTAESTGWTQVDVKEAGVLVVWPGTVVTKDDIDGPKGIVQWIKDLSGGDVSVTVVGTVKTLPSRDESGAPIEGTGGRSDFFFCIDGPGVLTFAVRRFQYGMRWWEDVYFNNQEDIYPLSFRAAYPDPSL